MGFTGLTGYGVIGFRGIGFRVLLFQGCELRVLGLVEVVSVLGSGLAAV